MNPAAERFRELESAFLAGVQANIREAGERVAGKFSQWQEVDAGDRVRAEMIDRRIFDHERSRRLPQNRGFILRSFARRLFFFRKPRSVTIASVIAPAGPLLESDGPPPPVTQQQVAERVRSLATNPRVPHLVGIFSPSGFDESAYRAPPELPNVTVVLIEPAAGGGWKVSASGRKVDERLLKLFNPENAAQKIDRVRREIEERSADLLTGGLSASGMAERLGLPIQMVRQAFDAASRSEPGLRVSRQPGDWLLYRGASDYSGEEDGAMSVAQWIRSLFSREGEESKKINVLSERRAALSDRLNRMYDDIGKLEKKEGQLVEEGKSASSGVVKRRLATQIAHMRKDIQRCNTSAALLSKQINVISTHIHNLQLAQAGSVASLPSSEELTEAAVNAEEMLEQLAASDDLVSGLDVSMAQTAMSEEEQEILKELEGEKAPANTVEERPAAAQEGARSRQAGAPAPPAKERSGPQAE